MDEKDTNGSVAEAAGNGIDATPPRIVVLGAGPGGYVAALRAAQRGAAVTLVEKDLVGGTCLNRGCIPTKALLASAEAMAKARAGDEYGFEVTGEVRPNFTRIMERKNQVVTKLRDNVEVLLKKARVQLLRGPGCLTGPRTVTVETATGPVSMEADKIILATGSEPAHLPMFDFSHPTILTSTSALELEKIPASMLIVGAGAIGCEFASFFVELGTRITIVEMMSQMLPLEDKRLAKQLQGVYRKRGVQVLLNTRVEEITRYADDQVTVRLSDGTEITAEKVLVSVGRRPNSSDLGFEDVGVAVDPRGYVVVDDYLETSVPGIYAIGDLNGGQMLAHVASYEAFVAVDNCFAVDPAQRRARDLRSTPSCTYSHPEVASTGLSEEEASRRGYRPVTGTYRLAALGKAIAMGEDTGYVTIVADRDTDLVLGAGMMGVHATDVIHEVALAVQNGLTIRQLSETIHAHPTIAEAVMEAAHEVHGESVHVVH
jgi:dihydrolipoamide dehydrogenase